jgi:hypothetical protein
MLILDNVRYLRKDYSCRFFFFSNHFFLFFFLFFSIFFSFFYKRPRLQITGRFLRGIRRSYPPTGRFFCFAPSGLSLLRVPPFSLSRLRSFFIHLRFLSYAPALSCAPALSLSHLRLSPCAVLRLLSFTPALSFYACAFFLRLRFLFRACALSYAPAPLSFVPAPFSFTPAPSFFTPAPFSFAPALFLVRLRLSLSRLRFLFHACALSCAPAAPFSFCAFGAFFLFYLGEPVPPNPLLVLHASRPFACAFLFALSVLRLIVQTGR